MASTLLIIGNGFDKKCGLKSSFSDYYNFFIKSEKPNVYSEFYNLIRGRIDLQDLRDFHEKYSDQLINNFSMWDMYFFITFKDVTSEKIMWFDVEKLIYNSFYDSKNSYESKIYSDYWSFFRYLYFKYFNRNLKDQNFIVDKTQVPILLALFCDINNEFDLGQTKGSHFDKNIFYDFLRKQLEVFEKKFREYLKNLINDPKYIANKRYYYQKLRFDSTNVLNFNYTELTVGNGENIENVHGLIDNNLSIIGIDSFNPIDDNELVGSYENVLVDIQHEYTMSSTIGYGPIKNASVGITFENHQSWDYTYSEGEEVAFEIENSNSLAGVALMQIQMKIIERIVVVEKKYGGWNGHILKETIVKSPTHTPYEFVIDYDLVPVFYNQLNNTEKSNFEYDGTSYNLKFINSYTPNFNYEYYSMIPSEIRTNYYY